MEIKKIPDNINISKLDLSNSNLKNIPIEVFKLKNLRSLDLSNNLIKEIPKEISDLKMLEVLDISNNKISNFFAKLCELNKLRILNLNNNQITSVPKQIFKLQRLRKIFLANNKIKTLPDEFAKLNNLVSVSLSKNPITELPDSLIALLDLKHLWLCNIPLKKAKLEIMAKQLTTLKVIYTFGEIQDTTSLDPAYYKLTRIKGNVIKHLYKIDDVVIKDRITEKKSNNDISNNKVIPPNMSESKKSSIFISYSHQDKEWLNKVQTHLKVLKYQNDIDFNVWDDTKILAGEKWKEEIAKALKKAKVAVLILSTDFLASDFIQSNELPELLNNANANGTKLLSIIVRPCRFVKQLGLNELQAINDPSVALTKMTEPDQEEILINLTDRIEEIIQQ